MKQYALCLLFLIFGSQVSAQDLIESSSIAEARKQPELFQKQDPDEDPVAATLDAAKFTYIREVVMAYETLLDSIDKEIEKAENDTKKSVESQLKTLNTLNAARNNFVDDSDNLPTEASLKSDAKRYTRQLAVSKKTLDKAFSKAADQYRKPPLKNFKAAAKTLADQKAFYKDAAKPSDRAKVLLGAGKGATPELFDKNWTASEPDFVKPVEGRFSIEAGPNGNYVLTKKNDYDKPDVTVTLSVSADTEAYLILAARQIDGQWRGMTSKMHFENGKILVGGHSSDFKPNNSLNKTEDGKPMKLEVEEDFELRLRIYDKPDNPDRLRVESYINSITTRLVHYPRKKIGEPAAVGFHVKKGKISIKEIEIDQ